LEIADGEKNINIRKINRLFFNLVCVKLMHYI